MKFSVGITLYQPKDEYINRINMISEEFDKVFVYDNSFDRVKSVDKLIKNPKVTYTFNGENKGLANAYNYFLENTLDSFDFLCILDQDSHFTNENISKMKKFLERNNNEALAIAAPSYSNLSLNNKSKNEQNIKVKWVINSGSFLNLKLIKKHNFKYDSNYFLDRIDSDFCKMINRKNLDIIVHKKSILDQELGYLYNKRSAHHPVRHYYIFRDRMYYNQKFYNKATSIVLSTLQSFKHLTNIIVFEDNKVKKINACVRGYKDFKDKKTGEISSDLKKGESSR